MRERLPIVHAPFPRLDCATSISQVRFNGQVFVNPRHMRLADLEYELSLAVKVYRNDLM